LKDRVWPGAAFASSGSRRNARTCRRSRGRFVCGVWYCRAKRNASCDPQTCRVGAVVGVGCVKGRPVVDSSKAPTNRGRVGVRRRDIADGNKTLAPHLRLFEPSPNLGKLRSAIGVSRALSRYEPTRTRVDGGRLALALQCQSHSAQDGERRGMPQHWIARSVSEPETAVLNISCKHLFRTVCASLTY
jgi:hypothetical protein